MEFSDTDKQKAQTFIARLTANPALKTMSTLQREEQILQFLSLNAKQLYPTLSSDNFFKNWEWNNIWGILVSTLYEITNMELLPEFNEIIGQIDTTFFTLIEDRGITSDQSKEVLTKILLDGVNNEQVRRVLTGSYTAITTGIVRKYISEIYKRKKYIHFELTKVEKLRLSESDALHLMNTILLIKPLIYMYIPENTAVRNTANGHVFLSQFTKNVAATFVQKFPEIPQQIFYSGMNSSASFSDDHQLEASARMSNILASMSRNYKPGMAVDKGADTALKSWINVSRKNYKFYGYDLKMLDELYIIAADYGW